MTHSFVVVSDQPDAAGILGGACVVLGQAVSVQGLSWNDAGAAAPRDFDLALLDLDGLADAEARLLAFDPRVKPDGLILLRLPPGATPPRISSLARDRFFTLASANLGAGLSDWLTLALAHLESRRDHQLLAKETELLKTVQSLFLTRELDKAYASVVHSITEKLGVTKGQVLLHDERLKTYSLAMRLDAISYQEEPHLTLPADVLDGILAGESKWAIVPMREKERGSLLFLPIRTRNTPIGLLRIPLAGGETLAPEQLHFAGRFAEEVSSVIENLILIDRTKELTIRDDLTKAYNRRYFESFVDEELERSRRYGGKFSIIFLDLDNLKDVNNRYGHLMGSRTLQEVSNCIISAVRGVDKVVRFGGDEFCIILPQTDHLKALGVARRVRDSISRESLRLAEGIVVAITASFGIASYPLHATTKEELLQKADQAMYKVKHSQKNAVLVAQLDNVEA